MSFAVRKILRGSLASELHHRGLLGHGVAPVAYGLGDGLGWRG